MFFHAFLPPAYEVRGEVIFLLGNVCSHWGGVTSFGCWGVPPFQVRTGGTPSFLTGVIPFLGQDGRGVRLGVTPSQVRMGVPHSQVRTGRYPRVPRCQDLMGVPPLGLDGGTPPLGLDGGTPPSGLEGVPLLSQDWMGYPPSGDLN